VADLGVVAKEVFQILRSFNYTIRPYDENGNDVAEPSEARRLMCFPKNLMVSLVDDDDNSRITLNIGKSVHISDVMGLDQKLRTIATKYNMIFRAQQYGKNITPKEFAALASIQEDYMMQVCEGMYGTSRSSYLRLENARMIVRHKDRIDDSKIGARGRCVESVFVENRIGERSRMPTNNLMAGRAMTQHVNQGGGFADPVGQQIGGMAMQYSNLGIGAGAAMSEAAGAIREACRGKMKKLRKTFECLARPNSYAKEAAEIMAQANVLTETEVPETRINEVRQLLNGDLSEDVYECCCKAMDEMREPVTEAAKPAELVRLLGLPVEKAAWHAFWDNDSLNLRGNPDMNLGNNRMRGWDKLAYKLSQVAAVVKDDGLANLFDRVAEELPTATDAQKKKIYHSIAVRAIRALNKQQTAPWFEGLATKNETVLAHLNWLNSFDPDRILTEIAWSPMDPSFDSSSYDMAGDSMMSSFNPQEFVDSPQMQDVISGRDPASEDNHLTRDEIIGAIEGYLRAHIDSNYPEQIGGFDDVSREAGEVYDQAAQAVQDRGFVIDDDNGLAEDIHDELTIEDVLLPKKNQGDDLAKDVTKADITDPDDPEEHGAVDPSYVSRLTTLAGMNVGTGGQSGPGY
jgi:hypothetical protein